MSTFRRINLGRKVTGRNVSDVSGEDCEVKSKKRFKDSLGYQREDGAIEAAVQMINPENKQNQTSDVFSITTASGDASVLETDRLKDDFYDVPCQDLARSLLGKILVRRLDDGRVLRGRIVETECYLGAEDQASHSYRGKMTERNSPMFMKPGTTYVYFTYGMYHCFNISSQGAGAAVLVRALEPLEGLATMAELRARARRRGGAKDEKGGGAARPANKPPLQPHELCSGPSKLCIAMDIDKETCNKRALASGPGLLVQAEEQEAAPPLVVVTKRVGIESAGREWADKPLRFYLLGSASVSKRDRAKEKELLAAAARPSAC